MIPSEPRAEENAISEVFKSASHFKDGSAGGKYAGS
jgi:hypothetical protein